MSIVRIGALLTSIVLIVLAAGCGQPRYDLTVRVTETDGAPIARASVLLIGLQESQLTDDGGRVDWTRLELDTVVLFVVAEGHMAHSSRVELQRGRNETVVVLERAPTDPYLQGP